MHRKQCRNWSEIGPVEAQTVLETYYEYHTNSWEVICERFVGSGEPKTANLKNENWVVRAGQDSFNIVHDIVLYT